MKRKVKYIAIHCTGASQMQSVESIQRYWRETKGWKMPGYHRLIDPAGVIHKLLDFQLVSNGVKGYNSETINICYIGGQHRDDRTDPQIAGILDCIFEALEWVDNPADIVIQGHRDFPNVRKECPQFNAKKEYEWITI